MSLGHLEPAIGRRTNIRRLIGQISQSDLPTLYSNLHTEQMSQRCIVGAPGGGR